MLAEHGRAVHVKLRCQAENVYSGHGLPRLATAVALPSWQVKKGHLCQHDSMAAVDRDWPGSRPAPDPHSASPRGQTPQGTPSTANNHRQIKGAPKQASPAARARQSGAAPSAGRQDCQHGRSASAESTACKHGKTGSRTNRRASPLAELGPPKYRPTAARISAATRMAGALMAGFRLLIATGAERPFGNASSRRRHVTRSDQQRLARFDQLVQSVGSPPWGVTAGTSSLVVGQHDCAAFSAYQELHECGDRPRARAGSGPAVCRRLRFAM